MDSFDEGVLRHDSAVRENCSFGVQVADQAAPLELLEKPELTDL